MIGAVIRTGDRRRLQRAWLLAASVLVVAASVLGSSPAHAAIVAAEPATTTTSIRLQVASARDSLSKNGPRALAPITKYRWLLNLDNTGEVSKGDDPLCHPSSNSRYPQGCMWPSVRYAIASPVLSEGTEADWNLNLPLPTFDPVTGRGLPNNCPTVAQPTHPCRYLVTVMADGYQMGGIHFGVPMTGGVVKVYLNPYPIPLGTVRLKVFDDSRPTDGTFDEQRELGIVGFQGFLNDPDGIVSTDYFGNPVCTQYKTDPASGLTLLDANGRPTPLPPANPAPPDPKTGYYNPTVPGHCLSDTNGDIVIPNIAPSHYSASVTPPDDSPTHWVQTTTLEGAHDFDVWVLPDQTGMDTELVVAGEPVPFVHFGFAHEQAPPAEWACPQGGTPGQTPGCGVIKGQLFGAIPYVPGINGLPGVGGANGQSGMKLDRPIDRGWVALNSLQASTGDVDVMIATMATDSQGYFTFNNVPDGDYLMTIWDEPQEYALDQFNVTVSRGAVVDMGVLPLLGWFAHVYGRVCIDANGNGRCDPGEQGLFHATVQNLNRTNNAMVGGLNTATTDNNGNYDFKEAYPLGLMTINQYFNTRFKTTGVTWQACNDPQEHTVVAPMVDVSYLPIIGQCGRLDWALAPYSPSANGDNGGIVATAIYDESRLKYNARQAQTLDQQAGIPGFRYEQYLPVKGQPEDSVDPLTGYKLNPDGSYVLNCQPKPDVPAVVPDPNCAGPEMQAPGQGVPGPAPLAYVSENNAPPAQCYPQDANGKPIGYKQSDPTTLDFMVFGGACIETSAAGVQFGLGTDANPNNPATANHPVQTVDGNYTLGNLPYSIPALNTGDVVVRPVSPVDMVLPACSGSAGDPAGCAGVPAGGNRALYTFTSEEDVNLYSGAQYIPQNAQNDNVAWPPRPGFQGQIGTVPANAQTPRGINMPTGAGNPCFDNMNPANPDAARHPAGCYEENPYTYAPGPDPICSGSTHVVNITNPDLRANGGSPLQGQVRHGCDMKLLNVQAGQSIAPNFHVHTAVDVPLPAHFWGYIVDDVSVETNPKSTNIGEVHGIPWVPVGVYDWTGRRVANVNSDYNGVWEILMPSSDISNCPSPLGICPNIYRFVGNDPGQPAHPNVNFDPNYRTISANFEAWPNQLVPADTAPTRVTFGVEGPGVQFTSASPCGLSQPEPQLFAIDKPYFKQPKSPGFWDPYPRASATYTIQGVNFSPRGAAPTVTLRPEGGGAPITITPTSFSDGQVSLSLGTTNLLPGSYVITITNSLGLTANSGLTFHVLGTMPAAGGGTVSYTPNLVTVAPLSAWRATSAQLTSFANQVAGESAYTVDPFQLNAGGQLVHPFAVQDALEWASKQWQDYGVQQVNQLHRSVQSVANDPKEQYLVVVFPRWDSTPAGKFNVPFVPLGTYFENIILHSPLKLQGVGPGGVYQDGTAVQGSILDGRFFTSTTMGVTDAPEPALTEGGAVDPAAGAVDPFADLSEPALQHWLDILEGIENFNQYGTGFLNLGLPPAEGTVWAGVEAPGEGAVVTVVATTGTYPTNGYNAGVDGFQISGGDQKDFPGNISEVSGARTAQFPEKGATDETAGALSVQGGAVYLNGGTDNFRITDNLVKQNNGSYGAIRFGSEFQNSPALDGGPNHNWSPAVSRNWIVHNGGTNLAGAVGIFDDSNGYSVDHNVFCMNSSAEYGGAVSHYGYSPNGDISYNRIFLNSAFDEGGAITIASEPAFMIFDARAVPDPKGFTEGSGPVAVHHNYIANNLAQDDGGAIRVMGTAGTKGLSPITIWNNVINNNVSAHEGGALSVFDSPLVSLFNNTIAKNLTTATATTSNGQPAPGGLSTGLNSTGLNDLLNTRYAAAAPGGQGWPNFSSVRIVNDIFWDNRAGSWTPAGVAGIGMPGDTTAVNVWDVGSTDVGALLAPTYSVLSSPANAAGGQGYTNSPTNVIGDPRTSPNFPNFTQPYDTSLSVVQQRTYFRFRPAAIVSVNLPPDVIGDYSLSGNACSAAGGTCSPAQNAGRNGLPVSAYVTDDIAGNARPQDPLPMDSGAYQLTPAAPAVSPLLP